MREDRFLTAVREAHHLALTRKADYAITRQLRVVTIPAAQRLRLSILEIVRAPSEEVA